MLVCVAMDRGNGRHPNGDINRMVDVHLFWIVGWRHVPHDCYCSYVEKLGVHHSQLDGERKEQRLLLSGENA